MRSTTSKSSGSSISAVAIAGTGHFLPAEVIDNSFFEKSLGLSDEWIVERTGIRQRRRASSHESASTLGAMAAMKALDNADMLAGEVDLLVCTTVSPDYPLPATACLIQAELGAANAVCFDISAACSGFLYGLEVAEKMLRTGTYQNALVVSVDLMTRWTDYTDPQTCVLFGDGAGAVVVSRRGTGIEILDIVLHSDGSLSQIAVVPGGGSKHPATPKSIEQNLHCLKMNGRKTFKSAVTGMATMCTMLLHRLGLTIDDIDLVIPHQANKRIIDALAQAINIDPSRVFANIERIGNTASASIPIALDSCRESKRLSPGSLVLFVAYGGGSTAGACLVRCS